MNAVIMGKSAVNEKLAEKLGSKGFTPLVYENISDIKDFSGEPGDFTITVYDKTVKAGFVFVTEGPSAPEALNVPQKAYSGLLPAAFVLDMPAESSAYLTELALKAALKLVRKKKTVYYFSRFMRTAGRDVEALYTEARRAGVNIIKYESLAVSYDENEDIYDIEVDDGFGRYSIKAGTLVEAGRSEPEEAPKRLYGKLRLRQDAGGAPSGGSSFLFPAATSRKGVFFLDAASVTGAADVEDRLEFVAEAARCELRYLDKKNSAAIVHAEVDRRKCAFCYTCYRACPHAAMTGDNENSAMRNIPASCSACGICVAVCPADAVSIVTDQAEKAVQAVPPAIEAASADSPAASRIFTGPLKIFCCENSGLIAFNRLKEEAAGLYDGIDVTSSVCGGDLSAEKLTAALKSYRKVLVVTCIDSACRHFEGNKRAKRSVERVRDMLKASGMDEGRIEILQASHAMKYVLRDKLKTMLQPEET